RRADVHRVGDGGHAGAWLVVTGGKVGGYHVIAVGRGDEVVHRQAELCGEQAGGEVAEVAGRHHEHRLHPFRKLASTVDVVEALRDQTGKVDGVRGGEVQL